MKEGDSFKPMSKSFGWQGSDPLKDEDFLPKNTKVKARKPFHIRFKKYIKTIACDVYGPGEDQSLTLPEHAKFWSYVSFIVSFLAKTFVN